MKTKAKTFHIIVWSMLTLVGFSLLAAKEPLYDGLGSYSRKVTTDSSKRNVISIRALAFSTDLIIARRSARFSKPRRSILNARWRTGA